VTEPRIRRPLKILESRERTRKVIELLKGYGRLLSETKNKKEQRKIIKEIGELVKEIGELS
jgi:hypothetical protein